jgi:hypothetical protein
MLRTKHSPDKSGASAAYRTPVTGSTVSPSESFASVASVVGMLAPTHLTVDALSFCATVFNTAAMQIPAVMATSRSRDMSRIAHLFHEIAQADARLGHRGGGGLAIPAARAVS